MRGEGLLAQLRFSRQAWVDERCRSVLARATPLVEDRLRPYGLEALFLAGSAACGQAVGWNGSAPFVLSDLDLGAITARRVGPETLEPLYRDLGTARQDSADPEVTVGVYAEEVLQRQVPTPGLFDAVAYRCVLLGEASWLSRFPMDSGLSSWEAYRLVGNRSRELLGAHPEGDGRGLLHASSSRRGVEAAFLLAKLAEGVGTAWLLAHGRYVSDRQARWEMLGRKEVPSRLREAALGAIPFLESPDPEHLLAVSLMDVRWALSELFRVTGRPQGVGVAAAYEYDPFGLRDRLRAWRRQAPHRKERLAWVWRSRFRGTPEARELGAAVLYWLALPERPEPDWGDVQDDFDGGYQLHGPAADPSVWDLSARLLGTRIDPGAGAKDRLRRCLGRPESAI